MKFLWFCIMYESPDEPGYDWPGWSAVIYHSAVHQKHAVKGKKDIRKRERKGTNDNTRKKGGRSKCESEGEMEEAVEQRDEERWETRWRVEDNNMDERH